MGNGAVNTHASCGHAARSGCTFKGLKSSPPPPQFSRAGALLLSISWPLSPPLLSPASMLRPFFSSPNVILLMWEEEQQPFWTP